MRLHNLFTILALISLGACGEDTSGTGGGTGGGSQGIVNNLGKLCTTTGGECGDGHECVFLTAGSDIQGSCSPICATEADCIDGYDGMFTGTVNCTDILAPPELTCTVQCEVGTLGDCPSGLSCVASMGPIAFCGIPKG